MALKSSFSLFSKMLDKSVIHSQQNFSFLRLPAFKILQFERKSLEHQKTSSQNQHASVISDFNFSMYLRLFGIRNVEIDLTRENTIKLSLRFPKTLKLTHSKKGKSLECIDSDCFSFGVLDSYQFENFHLLQCCHFFNIVTEQKINLSETGLCVY